MLRRNWKPGQRVTCYHKPFSEEEPEAEVTLIKRLPNTADYQWWLVRFDDGMEIERKFSFYDADGDTNE